MLTVGCRDLGPLPARVFRWVVFVSVAAVSGPLPACADHVVLQVEDFEGPWRRQTNIRGYVGQGFCTSNANPKVAGTQMRGEVVIERPGPHAVWARGFTSANSRRAFRVEVNGALLDTTHAGKRRRWVWERSGEVDLHAGEVSIVIHDADVGFESADAVLLTDRKGFDPMDEERAWLVFGDELPWIANALRHTIEASCRLLEKRRPPASREQWEEARPGLELSLMEVLGLDPLPDRTPLNPRITGRAECAAYTVENVVFESRPRFYVTANLYIPKSASLPAPAVVVTMGHAMEESKNYHLYHAAQVSLARLGFVVLGFDPIGQGERRLPGFGHHLAYGSFLVGRTMEGMMVWDAMRALDYLLTRPEVDPERIGLTGNSGGGMNTFYAMPVDERFAAGASFCFVCSYFDWVRDGGNHCICNHLPGVFRRLEEFEILALRAPRPILVGSGSEDRIFPIRGTRQAVANAQEVYGFTGAEDAIALVEIQEGHGWRQPLREAAYGWFARWLQGRETHEPIPEPAATDDEPKGVDLLCLKGDDRMPKDAETVVTLNRALADELVSHHARTPATGDEWRKRVRGLRFHLWEVLGGQPDAFVPKARVVRSTAWRGHSLEALQLTTEWNLRVAAVMVRPAGADGRLPAVVFLDAKDKALVAQSPVAQRLLESGVAILALDPRGMGETAVHENQLTSDSVCLGRHIFGQRVWDVLQAVRYLRGRADVDPESIRFYGAGASGLLGLAAAALGAPFERIAVEETLASYRLALENSQPQPIWVFVPDLLWVADVPQIAAASEPARLLWVDPVGYGKKPLGEADARRELAFASDVFALLGHGDGFSVAVGGGEAAVDRLAAFLGR